MRRYLTSPFLPWFAAVVVGAALTVFAYTHAWTPPPAHPYPVSNNANVQRAMALQASSASLPLMVKDPAARADWCATNIPLASSSATSARQEGTPAAANAFAQVAAAFSTFCADPSTKPNVGVALNNLATVVSGAPLMPAQAVDE